MTTSPAVTHPRFAPGALVRHRLFDYRGVVVDVDAAFDLTDEWYDAVAGTRPPKDQPWYHVLVDGAEHATYVAERNLAVDDSGEPIEHPWVTRLFARFEDGRYVSGERSN